MGNDFSVTGMGPEDLESISRFLTVHAAQPDDFLWHGFCENVRNPARSDDEAARAGRPSIIIDRSGAIRGFCLIRQFRHPVYRQMLDVPVVVIEDGPNSNPISRALYDHVLALARDESCDVVRFGNKTSNSWEPRLDQAKDAGFGLIMPLDPPKA